MLSSQVPSSRRLVMVYRAQDNLLDDARAVVGEGSTADNPAHVEAKNPAVLVPEAVAGEAVIDPVVGNDGLSTDLGVAVLVPVAGAN